MKKFAQAYEQHFRKVYRFLLSLTRNEHMADELTQEVFLKALLNIHKYNEQGTMLTWLCTIAKNLWLNECRRNRKYYQPEAELPDPSPGLEDRLIQEERHNALRNAVLQLPEEYRDVVILHIYADLPLKEIAEQKGKSESWGKVTFYRAKQMLAQKMEEFQ